MADGKWLTNLQATASLDDAARRVLAVRFQVVLSYLPKALHSWKEDVEYVHQLRVGTRRAGAALAIFSICLPKHISRKSRRHLRDLRRAAGAARDWDVFIADLAERQQQASVSQRPGIDFLLGYSQAQRLAAQTAFESLGDNAQQHWENTTADIIAAVEKPERKQHGRDFRDLAKPWLTQILDQLHDAAGEDLQDYDRLHHVRILGKRLRYGMEVFAPCFKVEFRNRYYPLVEEMQETLGAANDSHVACYRLAAIRELVSSSQATLWKGLRPGIDAVIRNHQRRLVGQRGQFFRWLARWQKSGTEAALHNLVDSP